MVAIVLLGLVAALGVVVARVSAYLGKGWRGEDGHVSGIVWIVLRVRGVLLGAAVVGAAAHDVLPHRLEGVIAGDS